MSDHPTDYAQLLAYASEELDGVAAATVAVHLAECAECAGTVRRLRLIRETVLADAAVVTPAALVAQAKGLLRGSRFDLVRDLAAPLRRIVAQLTFDSRAGQAAALAGFRGGSSSRQLAFAGAGAEVDLQLEPPSEPGSPWQMLGQVATETPPPAATVQVAIAGEKTVVASTTVDEYGVFNLAAPPGRYDFVVTLPDLQLVLPNLEVG